MFFALSSKHGIQLVIIHISVAKYIIDDFPYHEICTAITENLAWISSKACHSSQRHLQMRSLSQQTQTPAPISSFFSYLNIVMKRKDNPKSSKDDPEFGSYKFPSVWSVPVIYLLGSS